MIATRTRLAASALCTLAVSLGTAGLAQAKQTCSPRHATTLASDSYARVYGMNGNAYVCVRSNNKTSKLNGASPSGDQFALGGKFVAYTTSAAPDPNNPSLLPHSIVTVMHIPDHGVNASWYPFDTNETVDKVVVLSDGAAAWAMTPAPGGDGNLTQIQGTDRNNHPPDQFSDDHADVIGSSLHVTGGKTIAWRYVDGTSGSQMLF